MSDKVKMPASLPMRRVLENLGWKRRRLGPGLKGTEFNKRGADRKSNTCNMLSTFCRLRCPLVSLHQLSF